MLPAALFLYLRKFLELVFVGSITGFQLECLRNRLIIIADENQNHTEDALISLADLGKALPALEPRDLRVLFVYCYAIGQVFEDTDATGEVVDRWASGVDHRQAARLLGIGGRNPSVTARKRLVRVQNKLRGNSHGCEGRHQHTEDCLVW